MTTELKSNGNETSLIIKFTEDESIWGHGPDLEVKAKKVTFEGSWLIFFDVEIQKMRAIPSDLLDEVVIDEMSK